MKKVTTRYLDGQKEKSVAELHWDETLTEQENRLINLYPEVQYQIIQGFGGAFTDASGYVFAKMPEELQRKLAHDYFSPEGNAYTLGRTSVDSCDFSAGIYCSDNTPDDFELKDFDPARSEKYVLPLVKMAQEEAGRPIGMMLTPWSPPEWMKTNHSRLHGGELKPEYYSLWAEYICRFIEAYQQAGVDVKMLSSQNEPKAVQTWDSCLMNAAQEREFIQHHLYPALKRHHLEDVCLLIWDHNKERVFDRVSETLNNPEVAEMVGGAAVHWYSGDHFEALQMTHERFPKLQLVFSEGCVEFSRFGGTHQVRDAEMYAHDVIGSMNHGLNAFIDWNLLLDGKGGPNHVGNFCSAPAMYDEETGELRYNLSFDYLGHFSHYIRRGTHRHVPLRGSAGSSGRSEPGRNDRGRGVEPPGRGRQVLPPQKRPRRGNDAGSPLHQHLCDGRGRIINSPFGFSCGMENRRGFL